MKRVLSSIATLCCAFGFPSCVSTVKRVTVPPSSNLDSAPTITLTAVPLVPNGPGAVGDVEPGKSSVSSSTTVMVSRDAGVMLIGNARSDGGVQNFSLSVSLHGTTIAQGSASQVKDSAEKALNSLIITAPTSNPKGTINFNVSEPIAVNATAANFNGQSTTVTVTYVPADLTVSLSAAPSSIGFNAPSQATLIWSVLYGVPPLKMSLSNSLVPDPVPASGSVVVAPNSTTTYHLTATDLKGTRTADATVTVVKPPPPPTVSLSASPDNGYACLGTVQSVTWSVTGCGTGCDVTLSGQGTGYASSFGLKLTHLPTSGSYSMKPADTINFAMTATTATGQTGTGNANFTIVPPNSCPGAPRPTLMPFWFAVKASDPNVVACTWLQVWAESESAAESEVKTAYGSTYSVVSITQDDFDHQRKCP